MLVAKEGAAAWHEVCGKGAIHVLLDHCVVGPGCTCCDNLYTCHVQLVVFADKWDIVNSAKRAATSSFLLYNLPVKK